MFPVSASTPDQFYSAWRNDALHFEDDGMTRAVCGPTWRHTCLAFCRPQLDSKQDCHVIVAVVWAVALGYMRPQRGDKDAVWNYGFCLGLELGLGLCVSPPYGCRTGSGTGVERSTRTRDTRSGLRLNMFPMGGIASSAWPFCGHRRGQARHRLGHAKQGCRPTLRAPGSCRQPRAAAPAFCGRPPTWRPSERLGQGPLLIRGRDAARVHAAECLL